MDDEELGLPTPNGDKPPAYDAPRGSSANRDVSPLPAPTPKKPTPLPRASLDGETIFALGEGDDDDSDDDGEGRRLTSRNLG